MKWYAVVLSICIALSSILYAGPQDAKNNFDWKIAGPVTVDSLFRAIPPDRINIVSARQKMKPNVLDRTNGYLELTYSDQSGNSFTYTAALYTTGQKRKRIFLVVARNVHPIATFPSTDGFWIFEYSSGKCFDMTDIMSPVKMGVGGGLVKLPQKGTDLKYCNMVGANEGMMEVCTMYIWDGMKAQFREKK